MYLLINKISPELGMSSLVRIRGQQRRLVLPDLIYVLNNDEGLTHRFPVVDENWDLLMNGVRLQKLRALVKHVLLLVLILDTLLGQRNPDPHSKHAGPEIQQNHLVCHFYRTQDILKQSEKGK